MESLHDYPFHKTILLNLSRDKFILIEKLRYNTLDSQRRKEMKEIWIGKRFISDIRECCLFDNETMEERHFLATEEEVRQKCGDIPIRFTVNYEK